MAEGDPPSAHGVEPGDGRPARQDRPRACEDDHLARLEGKAVGRMASGGSGAVRGAPVQPAQGAGAPADGVPGPRSRPVAGPVEPDHNGVPLRILVADDDPANRRLAAWALTRAGHEVGLATNGDEAVTAVAEQRWDIILMDLCMPVVDGAAATRQILGTVGGVPLQHPPPIILGFTAHGEDAQRTRCLDAGMGAVLMKPLAPNALVDAIREHGRPLPFTPEERAVQPRALPRWLLQAFADDLLDSCAQLEAAQSPVEAREVLHRIAGASGAYGYEGLTRVAQQLGDHLRAGEASPARIGRLCRLIRQVVGEISSSGS